MTESKVAALPSDTFLMLGITEHVYPEGIARHRVMSFSKEDSLKFGAFVGLRANWALIIRGEEKLDWEWIDAVLRPLVFCSTDKDSTFRPVIWVTHSPLGITNRPI